MQKNKKLDINDKNFLIYGSESGVLLPEPQSGIVPKEPPKKDIRPPCNKNLYTVLSPVDRCSPR